MIAAHVMSGGIPCQKVPHPLRTPIDIRGHPSQGETSTQAGDQHLQACVDTFPCMYGGFFQEKVSARTP
jgi:hypothetical protein